MYTNNIKLEWDENKNNANIKVHGIDFSDGWRIFENPMLKKVDNRKDYGEERWIGLGKLDTAVIVIVYTNRNGVLRIISIRRANRNERQIYKARFEDLKESD